MRRRFKAACNWHRRGRFRNQRPERATPGKKKPGRARKALPGPGSNSGVTACCSRRTPRPFCRPGRTRCRTCRWRPSERRPPVAGWCWRVPDHWPEAFRVHGPPIVHTVPFVARRVTDSPGVADGRSLQGRLPNPADSPSCTDELGRWCRWMPLEGRVRCVIGVESRPQASLSRGEVAGVVRAARRTGERVLACSAARVRSRPVQSIEVGGGGQRYPSRQRTRLR